MKIILVVFVLLAARPALAQVQIVSVTKSPPPAAKPPERFSITSGWHFPMAGEELYPGNHWHNCPCGRVTQHGVAGFDATHMCKCGRVNLEVTSGPPKPSADPSDCPT